MNRTKRISSPANRLGMKQRYAYSRAGSIARGESGQLVTDPNASTINVQNPPQQTLGLEFQNQQRLDQLRQPV